MMKRLHWQMSLLLTNLIFETHSPAVDRAVDLLINSFQQRIVNDVASYNLL